MAITGIHTKFGCHIRRSIDGLSHTMPVFTGNDELVWISVEIKPDKVIVPCLMSKNQTSIFYSEVFGVEIPVQQTGVFQDPIYLGNETRGSRVIVYKDGYGTHFLSTTHHKLGWEEKIGKFVLFRCVDEEPEYLLFAPKNLSLLFSAIGL